MMYREDSRYHVPGCGEGVHVRVQGQCLSRDTSEPSQVTAAARES